MLINISYVGMLFIIIFMSDGCKSNVMKVCHSEYFLCQMVVNLML